MAAVYSSQLAVAQGVSGLGGVVYVCPAGTRTVVKCMTVAVGLNALPGRVEVRHEPSGANILDFGLGVGPNYPTTYMLWGMWVLNPGESLYVLTESWTADFFISGYELALP